MKKFKHWSQMLSEATSIFESKYPGGLEELQSLTTDDMDDEELSTLYNEASKAIVEPDVFLNHIQDDGILKEYYDMWDSNKEDVILSSMQYIENKKWQHVYKLVLYYGY